MRRTLIVLGLALIAGHAAVAQPLPDASTLKKSIAVGGFEGTLAYEGGDAAAGLTTMLTDALVKNGHYIVVERTAMPELATERSLTQGANTAAQIAPANVIIRGTVTNYGPKSSGGGISAGGFGMNSLGGGLSLSGDHTVVQLNLRLIDPSTGMILASINTKGEASSHSVGANVMTSSGLNVGANAFANSQLGQACADAIANILPQLDAAMDKVPWSSQVLSVDADGIYIAAGSLQNVQQGEVLTVYHVSKVLTDPSTGAVVDVIESPVATVTVANVREKTSLVTMSSGLVPVRGDTVRAK